VVTATTYLWTVYTGGDDERPQQRSASGAGTRGAGPAPPDGGRHDQGLSEERSAPCDSTLRVLRDPASYTLADEPLRPHDPVDWRYLYSLILERTEREEDRGTLLDAKVTSLLGGVVAFIGFSFRVNVSAWSSGAALLYIVTVVVLVTQFCLAWTMHDLGTAGVQTNSSIPAAHHVGPTRSNTHP
jgi:hypothetical protein